VSEVPKSIFTGILRRKVINPGSKSEHAAVVLELADGTNLRLRLLGDNPFESNALKPYVGMRVKIEGSLLPSPPLLTIDSVADITVLGPPGRPFRPPQP
jgi:hypothetical protein